MSTNDRIFTGIICSVMMCFGACASDSDAPVVQDSHQNHETTVDNNTNSHENNAQDNNGQDNNDEDEPVSGFDSRETNGNQDTDNLNPQTDDKPYEIGHVCTEDTDCIDHYCDPDTNQCAQIQSERRAAIGESCNLAKDCSSDFCDLESKCAAKPDCGENGILFGRECVVPGDRITAGQWQATDPPHSIEFTWRVLDFDREKQRVFLFAEYTVGKSRFLEGWDRTSWEECTMRSWLNGYGAEANSKNIDYTNNNFLDRVFSEEEQERIPVVEVENIENFGGNTEDKVFLLRRDDITSYFPAKGSRVTCAVTCECSAEDCISNKTCYWLRSVTPNIYEKDLRVSNQIDVLCEDGSIKTGWNPGYDKFYIRPALWLPTDFYDAPVSRIVRPDPDN